MGCAIDGFAIDCSLNIETRASESLPSPNEPSLQGSLPLPCGLLTLAIATHCVEAEKAQSRGTWGFAACPFLAIPKPDAIVSERHDVHQGN